MTRRALIGLLFPWRLPGGPLEFGLAEFQSALAARGMKPGQIRLRCELADGAAGSWRIEGTLVTGGDLQGLMYGLLEAATQVRARGWLTQARGSAALALRGVRLVLNDELRESSIEDRREFVRMLARSRINRLKVVVGEPEGHFEFLNEFARLCTEHAIDFMLAIPFAAPEGIEIYSRVKAVFAQCPLVRSLHIRFESDPDIEIYRDWLFRAVEEAGRRVTIELDRVPDGLEAQWPLRLARPFVDEPWESISGADAYFEVPSPLDLGAPVWGDPVWTRYTAGVIDRANGLGFEVDAPWPGQRHWFFFAAWGRIGYNPGAGTSTLAAEFERRYSKGKAADLYDAWTSASRAFTLASLIKPGRWIATAEEVEQLRGAGAGSAKLTPADIALAIAEAAAAARQALARAESDGSEAEDGANLLVLLETARQHGAEHAASPKPLPKPVFQHFPPKVAPANIKFVLGLNVKPVTNVRSVRLHYRRAGDAGEFRTMESPPSRAWFSVITPSDLIYYFEVLSTGNKGWFYPDPLAGTPYFYLPVRGRRTEPASAPKT